MPKEAVDALREAWDEGRAAFSAKFFDEARNSTYAQARLVEVLVNLGRFDEASEVLSAGRAKGGADVDLLRANPFQGRTVTLPL